MPKESLLIGMKCFPSCCCCLLPHAQIWCMGSVSRQIILHVGDVGAGGIEAHLGTLWKHIQLYYCHQLGVLCHLPRHPHCCWQHRVVGPLQVLWVHSRLGWLCLCRPAASGALCDQVSVCSAWLPTYWLGHLGVTASCTHALQCTMPWCVPFSPHVWLCMLHLVHMLPNISCHACTAHVQPLLSCTADVLQHKLPCACLRCLACNPRDRVLQLHVRW